MRLCLTDLSDSKLSNIIVDISDIMLFKIYQIESTLLKIKNKIII